MRHDDGEDYLVDKDMVIWKGGSIIGQWVDGAPLISCQPCDADAQADADADAQADTPPSPK